MIKELDIKNSEQANRINRLACEAPYEVWLHSEESMIDARSLLGIFPLVGQRVKVVVEDYVNRKSFDKLVCNMQA